MKIFYVNVLPGWYEQFYLIKICVSSHTLTLAQRLSLTNLCAYVQGISYMFREYPMCSGSTLCVQGVPYVFREYPMCSGSTLCVQGAPYVFRGYPMCWTSTHKFCLHRDTQEVTSASL